MASNSMMVNKKSKSEGCCSVDFLKYLLFIYNFVLLMAGIAVLGIGIWTVIEKHHYVSLLSTITYVSIAYLLIIAGAIVLLVTFVGCVGVWREDRWALLIYTFMLLLIFLMEAVSGIIAYVYQEQLRTELEANLNDTFLTSYGIDNVRTADIDALQRKFKCCGAINFEDWERSVWLKKNPHLRNTVPDSCCKTESRYCGVRNHPSNINDRSCIWKLEMTIKEHLILLGAIGLGICVVQIFGIILSCCLYIKLKDYEDVY